LLEFIYLLPLTLTLMLSLQPIFYLRPIHTCSISFFFFDNPGCPGQLTRTTTNPRAYWTSCKPNRKVRHRRGDRLVHEEDRTRDSHKASLAVDHWARPGLLTSRIATTLFLLEEIITQSLYFEEINNLLPLVYQILHLIRAILSI